MTHGGHRQRGTFSVTMEHCQRSQDGPFLVYHASGIANLLQSHRGHLASGRRCKLPGLLPAIRQLGPGMAKLDHGNHPYLGFMRSLSTNYHVPVRNLAREVLRFAYDQPSIAATATRKDKYWSPFLNVSCYPISRPSSRPDPSCQFSMYFRTEKKHVPPSQRCLFSPRRMIHRVHDYEI